VVRTKSRYIKKCAACGSEFNPANILAFKTPFPCPHCGVELEYAIQHKLIVTLFSFAVALGLPFILGMSGLKYGLTAIVTVPLAWLVTILIVDQIDPPPTQRYGA
jgi:hypothetical protein